MSKSLQETIAGVKTVQGKVHEIIYQQELVKARNAWLRDYAKLFGYLTVADVKMIYGVKPEPLHYAIKLFDSDGWYWYCDPNKLEEWV